MEYAYYWFIASVVFFLAEALGISGVGLLFAAIGAFCMGLLLQLEFLSTDDYVTQGAVFFMLTAFWTLVLWVPLKKMRLSNPAEEHNDMVGRTATVGDEPLQKGKSGHVRWSGTTMRARLADDASIDSATAGDELKIVKVDGATLILAQKDYPTAKNN